MTTSTHRPLPATATVGLLSITTLAVEPAPGMDTAKATAAPSAPKATSSEIASPVPAKDDTKASADAKADPSKDTYYLSDYLSTTLGTVDAAGVIDQMETDAFGAPLADGRAPTRFTGKPYDEDMGAYIFPFRNYRPDEARWMTPDPSGFPDGPNNRVYAANLMTEVDPTGLFSLTGWAPSPATATTGKDYDGNTHTVTISAYSNPLSWGDFSGNPQAVITAGGFTSTFSSANDVTLEIDTLAAEGQAYVGFGNPGHPGGGENVQVTASGGLSTGTNHWIQFVQYNINWYSFDAHSNYSANEILCDNAGASTDPFYDTAYSGSDSYYFFDYPSMPFDQFDFHKVNAIDFNAELFYVNVNGSAITVYGGFQYSWTME